MTEPEITFSTPDSEVNMFIEDILNVYIWAMDDVFDPWQEWAINEDNTTVTNN